VIHASTFLAEMAQEWQRFAEQVKGKVGEHHLTGPGQDPGDADAVTQSSLRGWRRIASA
jgi:hypothetical protein